MDQIVGIFAQLGVDETVFYQFGIFVVLFIVIKPLLFDRLQFVLEQREGKTTKLEDTAIQKMAQANELAEKYKERLNEAHTKAHDVLKQKKALVIDRETKAVKQVQDQVEGEFKTKRDQFVTELETKKKVVLDTADQLAGSLVQKLTE